MNPANRTGLIDKDQGRRVDAAAFSIVVLGRAGAVEFHDLALGVREDRKRGLELFLDQLSFLGWVDANGQDLNVQAPEIRIALHELTEFAQAVRSPVAAVEINQNIVASKVREPDGLPISRRQGEVRSLFAHLDLEWRDSILGGCRKRAEKPQCAWQEDREERAER